MPEGHHNNKKRQHSSFGSRRGRSRRNFPNRCKPVPPPPLTCSECSTLKPQYKCPTCRAPYCSIACCRKHKEKNCVPKEASSAEKTQPRKKSKYLPSDLLTTNPIETSKLQRQLLINDDDEFNEMGWAITEEMMNEMDKSDWLRKELQDGGLRQLVYEVYSASNTVISDRRGGGNTTTYQEEKLLCLQSKYPNFGVFLDKLKVLTGVLERQEEDDDYIVDLPEWLQCDGSNLGNLALKPLPSRRQEVNLTALKQSSSSEDSSDCDSGDSVEGTSQDGCSGDSSSDSDCSSEESD